jgi:hypothetical protein
MQPFMCKHQRALALSYLFLFAPTPPLLAQSGTAKSLEAGNRWVYLIKDEGYNNPRKQCEAVIGDTMIASNVYAIIARDHRISLSPFERADSSKIYAFVHYDSSEHLISDFNAEVGDTIGQFAVVTTGAVTYWGRSRRFIRQYYEFSYLRDHLVEYVEGIGTIYEATGGLAGPGFTKRLTGAVLDGQVYGDTTLTAVKEQPRIPPSTFYLLPPHPNPFKIATTIRFRLSNKPLQKVTVEIYDMAGRSVVTLLDQSLPAGEYQVTWDGSNRESKPMTGGVYFSRLSTERAHQVQKLLMVR